MRCFQLSTASKVVSSLPKGHTRSVVVDGHGSAVTTPAAHRAFCLVPTAFLRSRREATFPTTLTAAVKLQSWRGDAGNATLDEAGRHTPSTVEPLKDHRTDAEDVQWAPIMSRRLGGESGGGRSRSNGGGSATPPGSSPSARNEGTPPRYSTMHRPFMGTSTRFRNPNLRADITITRRDIQHLERELLSHSPPGRINDHLCIGMTRALRWLADRAFRERYIHRATMLVAVAPAAPAAAAVAAYLRIMVAPRKRLDTAPFVRADAVSTSSTSVSASSQDSQSRLGGNVSGEVATASSTSSPHATAGASTKRHNCYSDELRGLFSQAECHTIHYQILVNMAGILPIERALVLVLQALHFSFFLALFLTYPRMGFRLMAYMAEESSVVWTQMVNDIDLGKIAEHHVPELALSYWGLQESFTAQEALVPAVIPCPTATAPGLAPEESTVAVASGSEVGKRSEESMSTRYPQPEQQQQQQQQQPSASSMRIALPRFSRLTTRSDGEAVVQARRAASDCDRLTLRDVVLLMRSDEMVYRDLNHQTADALDRRPREPGAIASYIRERKWRR